jgi:hypothetical protein
VRRLGPAAPAGERRDGREEAGAGDVERHVRSPRMVSERTSYKMKSNIGRAGFAKIRTCGRDG